MDTGLECAIACSIMAAAAPQGKPMEEGIMDRLLDVGAAMVGGNEGLNRVSSIMATMLSRRTSSMSMPSIVSCLVCSGAA